MTFDVHVAKIKMLIAKNGNPSEENMVTIILVYGVPLQVKCGCFYALLGVGGVNGSIDQ